MYNNFRGVMVEGIFRYKLKKKINEPQNQRQRPVYSSYSMAKNLVLNLICLLFIISSLFFVYKVISSIQDYFEFIILFGFILYLMQNFFNVRDYYIILTLFYILECFVSIWLLDFESYSRVCLSTELVSGFNSTLFFTNLGGISLIFVVLTSFICMLCNMYSYRVHGSNMVNLSCILLLNLNHILAFSTQNILIFFIAFELAIIPLGTLIGFFGSRQRKYKATFYFLIYTILGSFLMLISLACFYTETSLNYYTALTLSWYVVDSKLWFFSFLLVLSFFIKVPVFPFHLWLLEAHVEASTVGSIILAGLSLKLGFFGIYTYVLPIIGLHTWLWGFMLLLCVISSLYCSLSVMLQKDLKRIIAYSSIIHMNLSLIGLLSGNVEGIVGALFSMLTHALISGSLFFCAGFLYERYKTRNIDYYGGLAFTMPVFYFFYFIGVLSNIALPLTCGFISEIVLLIGISKKFVSWLLFYVFLSIFFSVLYNLIFMSKLIYGNLYKKCIGSFADLNFIEFLILSNLFFYNILIGIVPCYYLKIIYNNCKLWKFLSSAILYKS